MEMNGYKESISTKGHLIEVIDALEKLKKEYTITKRTEIYGEDTKHPCIMSVWDVEEKTQ
ncbi:hypothetical protein PDR89_22880 [Bacillus cereus group sp. Bc002]|nr:hypothetical protein [Bacillus cereus group sp. Bc002]